MTHWSAAGLAEAQAKGEPVCPKCFAYGDTPCARKPWWVFQVYGDHRARIREEAKYYAQH